MTKIKTYVFKYMCEAPPYLDSETCTYLYTEDDADNYIILYTLISTPEYYAINLSLITAFAQLPSKLYRFNKSWARATLPLLLTTIANYFTQRSKLDVCDSVRYIHTDRTIDIYVGQKIKTTHRNLRVIFP